MRQKNKTGYFYFFNVATRLLQTWVLLLIPPDLRQNIDALDCSTILGALKTGYYGAFRLPYRVSKLPNYYGRRLLPQTHKVRIQLPVT